MAVFHPKNAIAFFLLSSDQATLKFSQHHGKLFGENQVLLSRD
jgi:hypothetical protein